MAAVASRHADPPAFQFAGIQLQNLVHDGGRVHRTWGTSIADKSQSLLCQLCYAAHLLLRHGQILLGVAGVMAGPGKKGVVGLEGCVEFLRERVCGMALGGAMWTE